MYIYMYIYRQIYKASHIEIYSMYNDIEKWQKEKKWMWEIQEKYMQCTVADSIQ